VLLGFVVVCGLRATVGALSGDVEKLCNPR
jgi:hypothetical protein